MLLFVKNKIEGDMILYNVYSPVMMAVEKKEMHELAMVKMVH
jgi:hypothetical protein